MKLKDKAAIVTGASDGIGKAIAIGYAQEGADVAVGYNRSKDKAEQVAEEIRALGRKAVVFRLEIAEMEDAQKMVDEAVDAFDRWIFWSTMPARACQRLLMSVRRIFTGSVLIQTCEGYLPQ